MPASSRTRNQLQRRQSLEQLEPRLQLSATSAQQSLELFNTSPALFVENQGQWPDDSIRFVHNGNGANIAMTDAGPRFQLFRREPKVTASQYPLGTILDPAGTVSSLTAAPTVGGTFPSSLNPRSSILDPQSSSLDPSTYQTSVHEFSASYVGANAVQPTGLNRSQSYFNYYVGDQSNWRSEVPAYESVVYENLYDDIDLHTFGQRSHLKYEFHVAPGADWSQMQIRYDNIAGLSLAADGSLVIDLGNGLGSITDDAPFVYQDIDGQRVEVSSRFTLIDQSTYSFDITGEYDPAQDLVIDPNLAWSTYVGGSGSDEAYGVATDGTGNIMVTGRTGSSGWISGGFDTTFNGGTFDAFVAKLSSTGSSLWRTYIGGTSYDFAHAIAINASGDAFVTGETSSPGWTSGGYDTSLSGTADAFVVKLSSSGSHMWSSYLGGSSNEVGFGVAVNTVGDAYVTGNTMSPGWILGGYDTSYGESIDGDGFVSKISTSGQHMWSSYLGGAGGDRGTDVAVDEMGSVLITGTTGSSGWVSGGFNTTLDRSQVFLAKLSGLGSHLWSTYLLTSTGWQFDTHAAVAVDIEGNAVVAGQFFLVKIDRNGMQLWEVDTVGSLRYDVDIATDRDASYYLTGYTRSEEWTSGGFDTEFNGGASDAFVAKIDKAGSIVWSTYVGGSSDDLALGVAVDGGGDVIVTGATTSADWTIRGYDTTYNGGFFGDGFVAKISDPPMTFTRDDAAVLARNFGRSLGATPADRDLTGDGRVDLADLVFLQAHFVDSAASPAAGALVGAVRAVHETAIDAAQAMHRAERTRLVARRGRPIAEVERLRRIDAVANASASTFAPDRVLRAGRRRELSAVE